MTESKTKKQVLINVDDKDIRVAVLEDGQLNQLFIEEREDKSIVGNVYKGRVESIVPGLKAAFIDIGLERNAFLHFSDVRQEYVLPERGAPQRTSRSRSSKKTAQASTGKKTEKSSAPPTMAAGEDHTRRSRAAPRSIELRTGDEILVQVTKESIDDKGARVTSYISLPGRYLVLLPYSDKEGGVSRRIEDSAERDRLRAILRGLKADEGSFIIRTAGLNQNEEFISSDVKKLQKLWGRIRRTAVQVHAPALVHDDHEILGRLVRDELTEDVDELIIDSKEHAHALRQTLSSLIPNLKKRIVLFDHADENLFEKHGVEAQFQKALRRRVWLKSGGYIVIDETEALVAIDVNTGKFVGKEDQETTILHTNLEAAEAVAQQIRLRDLGGIIVIDFIDMKRRENQHALLKRFKELLKHDRAKTTVIPVTEYGLMQMTRKRVRQSLSKVIFRECPYCQGSGNVLTESQIWKNIKYEIFKVLRDDARIRAVRITVHPELRRYLENEMLDAARSIANRRKIGLSFIDDPAYHLEQFSVVSLEESARKPHVLSQTGSHRRGSQKKAEKSLEKTGREEA